MVMLTNLYESGQREVYEKMTKEELISLVIECNRILNQQIKPQH